MILRGSQKFSRFFTNECWMFFLKKKVFVLIESKFRYWDFSNKGT